MAKPKAEEWELAEDPGKAEEIKAFFGAVPDPEEGEPQELTEELLAEHFAMGEKLKALEELYKGSREKILRLMGREENAMRGKYACFVKERKSSRVDWQRFCKDQFGEGLKELLTEQYVAESESKVLEVKKVGE